MRRRSPSSKRVEDSRAKLKPAPNEDFSAMPMLGDRFAGSLAEDRQKALPELEVSRETIERLGVYVDLLLRWQSALNLVAPSTLPSLWTRHILDSAQIGSLLAHHTSIADIGSGGGFPGLVLAILATQEASQARFQLIESDQRKASFLREAARVTGAPARVHGRRAEEVLPELAGEVTAVTARALAPLPRLLDLAEPLLTTGAEGFFPKGETLSSEVREASELFDFESRTVPSKTDEKGRILVLWNLRRHKRPPAILGNRK